MKPVISHRTHSFFNVWFAICKLIQYRKFYRNIRPTDQLPPFSCMQPLAGTSN